jgi:hypothetical protein
MRLNKLIPVLAALAVASAACGGSAATGAPGATGPAATVPAATVPAGSTQAATNRPDLPGIGGGSCSVNVTGDVTKSWTDSQSASTLLVGQWLTPASKAILKLPEGEASLIFNCESDGVSVNFLTTNDTTTAQFIQGPKDYVISAKGILGGGDPGQIGMLINFKDDSLWKVIEPGSFKVTTFNGNTFAGTFTAKIAKADDSFKYTAGFATITGTFDLKCTTGNACS